VAAGVVAGADMLWPRPRASILYVLDRLVASVCAPENGKKIRNQRGWRGTGILPDLSKNGGRSAGLC
jgi:hypothetical protein